MTRIYTDDEISMPEGYYIRHTELGAGKQPHRTVVVCEAASNRRICEFGEYFDGVAGKVRYVAKIILGNNVVHRRDGDAVYRYESYNLQELALLICARHRLTLTRKG